MRKNPDTPGLFVKRREKAVERPLLSCCLPSYCSSYVTNAHKIFPAANWGIFDPAKTDSTLTSSIDYALHYLADHEAVARKLHKPLVMKELGIFRNGNSRDPAAPVTVRDQYYTKNIRRGLPKRPEVFRNWEQHHDGKTWSILWASSLQGQEPERFPDDEATKRRLSLERRLL